MSNFIIGIHFSLNFVTLLKSTVYLVCGGEMRNVTKFEMWNMKEKVGNLSIYMRIVLTCILEKNIV
jgi:hypothetical protein